MKSLKCILLVIGIFGISSMQASQAIYNLISEYGYLNFKIAQTGFVIVNTMCCIENEKKADNFRAQLLQAQADNIKLSLFDKTKPSPSMHKIAQLTPLVGLGLQTIVSFSQGDYIDIALAGLVGAGVATGYYCDVQLDYAQRKTIDNQAPYLSSDTYKSLLQKIK